MSISILEVGEEHADFVHDESRREGRADRIVFPESTEEVRAALAMAAENLRLMFGAEGVSRMRSLKSLFDPAARLNRGNLFGV